jgi:hypothetical protein
MTNAYDKQRQEVVEQIARNGRCKTNEARDIARELLELRKHFAERTTPVQDTLDYLGFGP